MNGEEDVEPEEETADAPEEGGDGQQSEADPPGAEQPPRRSQRRRLEKAKREELGRWDYLVAHGADSPYEVILRGEGIGADGGSATKIGAAIARVARLFEQLVPGTDAYMKELRFANSVHIEFRPSAEERVRAQKERERAEELRQKLTDEDVEVPDERALHQAMQAALPNIQVATALAADLLDASAGEAPQRSVELGTGVAQSYKTLAHTIAREKVTLSVEAPDREEPAQLSPRKAEQVAEALKTVTEPTKVLEVVLGTLTIADAEQKMFGLVFDRGAARPEIFRGKRLIRGSYTPQVGDLMRDEGLWGKRVRATIEVTRDALLSTSTIRPPSYRLIDVEQAVT